MYEVAVIRAIALGVAVCISAAACYHRACRVVVRPATEADCAPATNDDPCTSCLKALCCRSTVAYLNRAPGGATEAGACAEAHCTAPCTRPDQRGAE